MKNSWIALPAVPLFVSVILISGCAVTPTVTYKKIDASTTDIADSYFLNSSRLTISPAKSTEKNATPPYSVNVESVEFLDEKIGIIPTNNIFKTIKVNVTKVENSDRVASIGVETTENIKSFISTVGGIAVKAIGAGLAPGNEQPSCAAKLTEEVTVALVNMAKREEEFKEYRFKNDDSTTQCIRVDYGPIPPDAIPFEQIPWGIKTEKYYYAACRNAKITVRQPGQSAIVKSARVADPRFVQFVQFPFKGSITMHSQCGVSVKTDANSNPFSGLEIAGELIKQIEAIKAANK